jgi:hypothetical protein
MAENGNANGEFSFGTGTARNGLAKIQTHKKQNGICHDDSGPSVKAQTIDELHSLQKKRSAPTTPIKEAQGAFATITDEDRQKQQLQSIRLHKHATHTFINNESESAIKLTCQKKKKKKTIKKLYIVIFKKNRGKNVIDWGPSNKLDGVVISV